MLVGCFSNHDRHYRRSFQQFTDKIPDLAVQALPESGTGEPGAGIGQLLSAEFKFYFFTCLQSFRDRLVYFYNFKSYRELALVIIWVGIYHLLCPGICRCTFPPGYHWRGHYREFNWLWDEYIFQKAVWPSPVKVRSNMVSII